MVEVLPSTANRCQSVEMIFKTYKTLQIVQILHLFLDRETDRQQVYNCKTTWGQDNLEHHGLMLNTESVLRNDETLYALAMPSLRFVWS